MLGGEQLAHDALVGGGALLDRPVVAVVEPGQEAVAPEPERAPQALGGLGVHRPLLEQLLEPGERGLGRPDPRLRLLALGAAVVAHAEDADQAGQREPLERRASRG